MPLTDRLGIACVSTMALALSVLTESLSPTTSQHASPDAIYYNGHIVTMWADHPEVEAVAIRGDRFQAVGRSADVRKLAASTTRLVDLGGRTVLPGLEDSHTHPITAALSEQDGPIPVMNSVPSRRPS
jgi:predicted amidohydrolase YtcJ